MVEDFRSGLTGHIAAHELGHRSEVITFHVKGYFVERSYYKQGDLDDAREITAVWTYFRDNQVEKLKLKKKTDFVKGDKFIIVKILFCLISSHLF